MSNIHDTQSVIDSPAQSTNEMKSMVNQYLDLHDDELEIKNQYETLVNNYYDLATKFYEFGWGRSFHFAPSKRGESFKDSLLRHQRFLGDKLSLSPGLM
ncbi:MAG: hypothetical protein OXE92_10055 [Bacteroidetes bacterium]|nr:hypothetical protein [Bacteroidota bacterium]MCY4206051.1 hypothetical protein [Bacteroidota bacterium]